MDLVIKNGTVVLATEAFNGDLAIKDGRIAGLSLPGTFSAREEIDASGCLVMPGVIDAHTHFALPVMGTVTADDFLTGSRACAAGGVTTFIDFATQEKGKTILDAIQARRAEADSKVCVDYSLHAALTDFTPDTLASISKIVEMGVPSIKLYLIYAKEGLMADDGAIMAVLQEARDNGAIVGVHAENNAIIERRTASLLAEGKKAPQWHAVSRPHYVEVEALRRMLFFTEITASRLYVFHLTTAEGTRLIGEAKGKGMTVFAETCPHYLLLTEDKYSGPEGHQFPGCPPLRKPIDNEMLWRGLAVGAIQVVSTDHCSFSRAQKDAHQDDFSAIPRGLPGVETLLPLMYSEGVHKGRINVNQLVEVLSTNPAKLFGLFPRKGTLAPGSDADIVIFDPSRKTTIQAGKLHMNTDFSPYEGMEVTGAPKMTILRGRVIYKDGEITGKEGCGEFVPRYYTDPSLEFSGSSKITI